MHFSQTLAALLGVASLAASRSLKLDASKNDLYFQVSAFTSTVFSGAGEPKAFNDQKKSFSFTVTDFHDQNSAHVPPYDTTCYAVFTTPPTQAAPGRCSDSGFSWYFAQYAGVANFTLNIQHGYLDPAIGGPGAVYFGTGNNVNTSATKGIFQSCTAFGPACVANFRNASGGVVVPITSAIA